MKTVQFTIQEIWAASRHTVQTNKKKYDRNKDKQVSKDRKDPSYI